jgi:HD-GYP domain-containing protein (c-di-GMP phosphodiesterase class II)
MRSLGKPRVYTPQYVNGAIATSAGQDLREAREHERASRTAEAIRSYTLAVEAATALADNAVLAESLRRLAILRHRQGDFEQGRELCLRSYDVACANRNTELASQALNTMGVQYLQEGSISEAKSLFTRAIEADSSSRDLRARVEQNLGIIANIQGELDSALEHYTRSLEAFRSCGDEHGCAIAYHNLALISTDRGRLDDAEHYVRESQALAEHQGDLHLQGLCLVTQGEIDVARQRFENAQQSAEEALAIFNHLGSARGKADAYRLIGMVYRETSRHTLAESRLRSAIDLASQTGAVLIDAEASRELALLYQQMGRNQDTLQLLNRAYVLFGRLNARHDLVNVGGKVSELESTYFAVVRDWGRSIESRDSATFGHCERVARQAVAMSRVLGLDEHTETTLLLGACLHDLGLLKVPHEILRKKGQLTAAETEVVRQHPLWGLELLAGVEFPWELKPIIRWHHERCDGTGYPDGLTGDEIPLGAQVVGILDWHDELTTGRLGNAALTPKEAFAKVVEQREWWSDKVIAAFQATVVRA